MNKLNLYIHRKKLSIGDKFNKWEVISESVKHKTRRDLHYLCRCECGTEQVISGYKLRKNKTNSCRNCKIKLYDLNVKEKYGKWTTLNKIKRHKGRILYKCKCDCGLIKYVHLQNLKSGLSTQCLKCLAIDNRIRTKGKKIEY